MTVIIGSCSENIVVIPRPSLPAGLNRYCPDIGISK
jgi:hypothetical protein